MTDDINELPRERSLVAFPLVSFADVRVDTERRTYRIKGILPDTGLALIWGAPKSYKSFAASDIGLHIALGWPYRGRRVQQCSVIYIALEGRHGIPARIEAFKQHHNVEQAPFYLMTKPLDLASKVNELIASIGTQMPDKGPGVIFIDTLNRSLVGSESQDKDMARYIAAADKIAHRFGCLVVLVHHSGLDVSRPRGHTSLPAAVDAQIACERHGDTFTLKIELAKDFGEGDEFVSRVIQIDTGLVDPDGDPIKSLVVIAEDNPASKPKPKRTGSKATKLAIEIIGEFATETIRPFNDNLEVEAANVDAVREEFNRRWVGEPDAKRQAWQRIINDRKFIGHRDGKLWVV